MTKAEDKCLSVACASIISRYKFIELMNKLSDEIHIPLPKGASNIVDDVAKEIKEKYGMDMLYHVAKMNFSNVNRLY